MCDTTTDRPQKTDERVNRRYACTSKNERILFLVGGGNKSLFRGQGTSGENPDFSVVTEQCD